MHRVSLIALAVLASWTTVRADNLFAVSVGAGAALPVRSLRRILSSPGYGGTGTVDFFLNDNISILASGGYYTWRFSSDRVNSMLAASGAAAGYNVSGPFQAVPVLIGARLTFDGETVRPYFGIAGGACFLRRNFSGSTSAPGAAVPSGDFPLTWTEPAMSVDAGLKFVLTRGLTLDIGGIYTAFSNADDRVEPAEFFGTKLAGFNTATYFGIQAGVAVAF
jgi:opacity protein-like surface antigen